jgi:hypothetical protein
MKILSLLAITVAITTSGIVACSSDPAVVIPPVAASGVQVKKTMKAFKSDYELLQYFRKLAEKQRLKRRKGAGGGTLDGFTNAAPAAAMAFDSPESITNVQHEGVDEGGIVKVHGNHLVVLRRGRLFTVAIGDGALKPISAVDAFGPEMNPQGTWYDEMLVSDNTVVAKGDGMWAAEVAEGDVALMRIPIMTFSDGTESVPASSYKRLQKPKGYTFHNRFISDYLIYGTGSGWGQPQNANKSNLFIVNWRNANSHQLPLPHGVDRIEQLGSDAVIVGTDGKDLHFSSVKLSSWPEVIARYTRKEASQGELRSHGFFYKPDGETSGTLGLPISIPGRAGYKHLFQNSAAILFLRNDSLHFREIGELESNAVKAVDDNCRASCVDWYGNARPLFLKGRVFALLGYEIVEGKLDTGRMSEVRRTNFAPGRQQITRGE